MTKILLCDENGYLYATALPDDAEDCGRNGLILGPPKGMHRSVHNELAKAGIYNAFDLIGRRPNILKILDRVGVDRSYLRDITHLYQKHYFIEDEG